MAPLILLALLIAVPIAEIMVLIEVGGMIGTIPTVALVILTAVVGTALIRIQGQGVLNEARRTLDTGETPVAAVIDGVFLLLAGVLLLTPGFVTDAIGFLFLVPGARHLIAHRLRAWIESRGAMRTYSAKGGSGFDAGSRGGTKSSGPTIIEADYVEVTPERSGNDTGSDTDTQHSESPWKPGSAS